MKRIILPFILLIVLALEGVAIELLPVAFKASSLYIIPHWILLVLILATLIFDKGNTLTAIVYGAVFGLMIDIVYTGILGVYMFVIPFTLYIAGFLNRFLQTNWFMSLVITAVCLFITELSLYSIYSFIGTVTMTFSYFLSNRFLPTLIANLLFMVIIYYPMEKLLFWINTEN